MISDPRQYTHAYPKTNIVIDQALQVISNKLPSSELDVSIAGNLRRENDALINVALNLSPSNEVCREVWESLNRAINSEATDSFANIFAIPVVLVAGSKVKAKLKSHIDVNALNLFCTENGLFNPEFDCFISGKLIEPSKIAAIKPSQIYYWVRNLQKAKLWLPIEMEGSSIEVLNEGVFLRFLVGVTIDNSVASGLNVSACNGKLMQLMQLINAELQTDGVTLFPMPFAPVSLLKAFSVGTEYRTEIAISVAVSNIVKKIREQRLTPVATISTDGEALKIVVKSREPSELIETSICTMSRFANFGQILQTLTNLLHDIGIEWDYVSKPD